MAERVASSRQRLADLVREASRGGPLERVVEAISPKWAQRRAASRVQLALAGGGYHGGGRGRPAMRNFNPGGGDANDDTLLDLPDLRDRSRDLVRNAPIATGAIGTLTTNIVGTGLALQPAIDAKLLGLTDDEAKAWQDKTNAEWKLHAESVQIDIARRLDFYGLQALGLRSALENGDAWAFLTDKEEPGHPYSLALQLVEADRICNENFKADSDECVQGIQKDSAGQKVGMWICNRHPGSAYTLKGFEWKYLEFRGKSGRRNVLHLMRKMRPGQTRGIPALAPIIETLKQLTRYSTAEVDAAVNSAAMAVFVKMDPDTFQDIFDDTAQQNIIDNAKRWDGTLQSGAAINLLPGEDISTTTPGRPNPNFDPFVSAVMGQIGMALHIPKEVLMKHFQASYSAARAALLDAWRTFRIRRSWLAARFCQPVYEEWLADAVASGLIAAPGFFADPLVRAAWCGSNWAGDGPGALDPLKEAQAAEKRIQIGMTTLPEEIVGYDGGDWEQKHQVQKRVQDERVEAGLAAPITAMPGAPGVPGAPGAAPAEDGTEDETPLRGLARLRAMSNRG